MPFGMGPRGWAAWPYMGYWMRHRCPGWTMPYGAPFPSFSKKEEENFLEGQAKMLEDQLAQIKKRLDELKKQEKNIK